jgi:hypothetical protein
MASIKKVVALRGMGRMDEARQDMKDIGLGAITMTSALAGLLIKEKKPVEGEEKRTGLAGVWDWIQEKPLRATGYGFMVSTAFHGWATWGKYKIAAPDDPIRKTIALRGVFVAANVIAELLMVVSSKGHGQGVQADKSTDDTVFANAAQIIARQNPAQQDALIERLAGYMSSPDIMGGRTEEIAAKLREHVHSMGKNPWATAAHTPAAIATVPGTRVNAVMHEAELQKPSTAIAHS